MIILILCFSQGSVATRCRCGGKYDMNLVPNLLMSPTVKNSENRSTFIKFMNERQAARFCGSRCIISCTCLLSVGDYSFWAPHMCVCPSVCGPSVKMVRFTSGKHQNVPRRSLYRPAVFWRWKVKSQGQGREHAKIVFRRYSVVTPMHGVQLLHVQTTIPGAIMPSVLRAAQFLVKYTRNSLLEILITRISIRTRQIND